MRIVGGDGEKFADSGEVLRKKLLKLGRFLAPLDACFRTPALRDEAHLLDLLTVAGAALFVDFFSNSGGQYMRMVRARERAGENGLVEMNKDGMTMLPTFL
jgi:hypothetical protein